MDRIDHDPLKSSRVRLRPHFESDVEDHLRWRNDAEVAYFATARDVAFWPVASSTLNRWFSEVRPGLDPRTDGLFAVDLLSGRHIGMVDYRNLDSSPGRPRLGSQSARRTSGVRDTVRRRFASSSATSSTT